MEYRAACQFWSQDAAHVDQKFYTAFCMLTSVCCDYAIGIDLHDERKLNWAATSIYYSLIHTGRLVCFLPLGDFPIGHRQLGELFARGNTSGPTWLTDYRRRDLLDLGHGHVENRFDLKDIREGLSSLRIAGQTIERAPRFLGVALPRACKLRNDANYEDLLIAHEYSHQRVTRQFEQLTQALNRALRKLFPHVVKIFRGFMDSSPRRDCWYAFLNWEAGHGRVMNQTGQVGEGLHYLEASLRHKVANRKAISDVLHWLEPLRCPRDSNLDLAEHVHENIVMSSFGAKNRLMQDFERKIHEFEQELVSWK